MKGEKTGIEENKEVVRVFTERMGSGDSSVLDELATEDFKGHLLVNGDQVFDKQMSREINDRGHRGFPDYTVTIDDIIAEGDKVLALSIRKGTNTGVFINGIPPTGNKVEISRFVPYRLENGKIAEIWMLDDMMGQYIQLGYLGSREEILKAYMEKQ